MNHDKVSGFNCHFLYWAIKDWIDRKAQQLKQSKCIASKPQQSSALSILIKQILFRNMSEIELIKL